MDDGVVITGAGMVCSLGQSPFEVWNALLAGKEGTGLIEGFGASGFDCQMAAQVQGLSPEEMGIPSRDSRIMDKHSCMLMRCSRDAFMESRLKEAGIEGEDIGFFVAMGMVDYEIMDLLPALLKTRDSEGKMDYDRFYLEGYQEIYPLWPLSMLNNIAFCQVAIHLDIRGENAVFSPHSDSCLQAIAEGVKTIQDQKARVVLAGGVSEKVSPLSLARAHLFNLFNTSDRVDEVKCHPFSSCRKGTPLGEGCGILVLESCSSAVSRGVPFRAMITGYGASCGAGELSASSPLSFAMKEALAQSDLNPSDIDLIIANGDGTYRGDQNEIEAIHHVFSDCIKEINVFSSKGALGNMLGASPAVDIILGTYMIEHGIIPATLNPFLKGSPIRFNLVCGEPLKFHPKRIMINGQSYEGPCSSLIIEACN